MPATNPPPARGLGDASAKDLREDAAALRAMAELSASVLINAADVRALLRAAELCERIAALEERAAKFANHVGARGTYWYVSEMGNLTWTTHTDGVPSLCAALSQMGERT